MERQRRMQALIALLLIGLLCAAPEASGSVPAIPPGRVVPAGRVLQVGAGRAYTAPSQAAQVAQDGDTVVIDSGTYANDWAIWKANNLTIRAASGIARMQSSGLIPNGKAIWVIQGNNTTVEQIEFAGAAVKDKNGAGIRQEGDGLTVRACSFHDNENGILGGGSSSSDVLIEYSEFANNGYGDGYTHNMYIANVRTFTLRYSYSHHAKVGHTVKSRARENRILYNRIMDEVSGRSSYTVDLPNGGTSYLIGNALQQGPATENPAIISYAEEGATNPDQHLYVVNNTIVNDQRDGGTFIRVVGAVSALVKNNIFVGAGTVYSGPGSGNLANNLITADAGLADRAGFNYHVVAGSPAIDAGAEPGSVNGFSLLPSSEYVHPHNMQDRTVMGTLDIGAYEYLAPATEPPAAPTGLVALPRSFVQIDLSWTDTVTNETGFKIERRTSSSGYAQIATVGANVRAFADTTGLRANTRYFYRVRATNARGNSAYTNEASATTLEAIQHFLPLTTR